MINRFTNHMCVSLSRHPQKVNRFIIYFSGFHDFLSIHQFTRQKPMIFCTGRQKPSAGIGASLALAAGNGPRRKAGASRLGGLAGSAVAWGFGERKSGSVLQAAGLPAGKCPPVRKYAQAGDITTIRTGGIGGRLGRKSEAASQFPAGKTVPAKGYAFAGQENGLGCVAFPLVAASRGSQYR